MRTVKDNLDIVGKKDEHLRPGSTYELSATGNAAKRFISQMTHYSRGFSISTSIVITTSSLHHQKEKETSNTYTFSLASPRKEAAKEETQIQRKKDQNGIKR